MAVYVITYVSLVLFIGAILVRTLKILSTPLHLRWELYPVAHEPGDKPQYGGSYLEEQNWWEKPRHTSFINMMKVQLPEMFFLTAVYENNRPLWFRSFPFHFGLYLLFAAVVLLLVSLIPGLSVFMLPLASIVGIVGIVIGLYGSLALFIGRVTQAEYEGYNAPADILNLGIFIVSFGTALIGFIFFDPGFTMLRGYLSNLITFQIQNNLPSSYVQFEIIWFSLLLAYIPLTHMAHFFVKYFTYHDIRWNDEPNIKGGKYEKAIQQVLAYRVTWSAPHIKGEGKKNWVDVAMEDMKNEEKVGN